MVIVKQRLKIVIKIGFNNIFSFNVYFTFETHYAKRINVY